MFESMLDGMMGVVEGARFNAEVPVVRDVRTTWEGTIWVLRRGPDPAGEALALSGTGEGEPGPIDVLKPGGSIHRHIRTGASDAPGSLRAGRPRRLRRDGRIRRGYDCRETPSGDGPLDED